MSRTIKVPLAEDQSMVREALAALLGLEADIEVVAQVARGDAVLDAAREHAVDVALLASRCPARRASRPRPASTRNSWRSSWSSSRPSAAPVTSAAPSSPAPTRHRPRPRRSGPGRRRQPPHEALAATLHLSQGTVRNHLSTAIQKPAVRSRAEAVRAVREKGWL